MTDQGLTFYASVIAANGARLNRETDNRAELLEWLGRHAAPGAGTIDRVGMAAEGPAIAGMLTAIEFGRRRMAARAIARELHEAGASHECEEWRTAAGVCEVCGGET